MELQLLFPYGAMFKNKKGKVVLVHVEGILGGVDI
jgi:hypothetical protein